VERDNSKYKSELKKRLYTFSLNVIEFIDKLPNDNVARRLSDQLLRSGTSIIGNFVEGQAASSKRDFVNYLNIALKSSNETKLWLALLRDSKRAKAAEANVLLQETTEIGNILGSSILTLRGKR
jgi:four helix bundle protein